MLRRVVGRLIFLDVRAERRSALHPSGVNVRQHGSRTSTEYLGSICPVFYPVGSRRYADDSDEYSVESESAAEPCTPCDFLDRVVV